METLIRQMTACALLIAVMALGSLGLADAAPFVTYSASDLGGGMFEYDLTIHNDGGAGPENGPVIGLLVLHGDTVFGLDDTSPITAPTDWGFFAPLPGLVDSLDFFSLAASADVPVDDVLTGFSFKSATDPASLAGDNFAVEAVAFDADGNAVQVPMGNASVPEPGSLILLAGSVLALIAVRKQTGPRGR